MVDFKEVIKKEEWLLHTDLMYLRPKSDTVSSFSNNLHTTKNEIETSMKPIKKSKKEKISKSKGKKKHASNFRLNDTRKIGDNMFECPVCLRAFQRYRTHKRRRKLYQCCVCWINFNNEPDLVEHLKSLQLEYLCCSCKKIINHTDKKKFDKHIQMCHTNQKARRRNSSNAPAAKKKETK